MEKGAKGLWAPEAASPVATPARRERGLAGPSRAPARVLPLAAGGKEMVPLDYNFYSTAALRGGLG